MHNSVASGTGTGLFHGLRWGTLCLEGISKMGDREEMLYFPASHSIFSYRWVTILHPSGILLSWNKFNPEALKKKRLIFLCNTAWPRHKLGDGESWPENGSLNYNAILHLDLFCRKLKKMDRTTMSQPLWPSEMTQSSMTPVRQTFQF